MNDNYNLRVGIERFGFALGAASQIALCCASPRAAAPGRQTHNHQCTHVRAAKCDGNRQADVVGESEGFISAAEDKAVAEPESEVAFCLIGSCSRGTAGLSTRETTEESEI